MQGLALLECRIEGLLPINRRTLCGRSPFWERERKRSRRIALSLLMRAGDPGSGEPGWGDPSLLCMHRKEASVSHHSTKLGVKIKRQRGSFQRSPVAI